MRSLINRGQTHASVAHGPSVAAQIALNQVPRTAVSHDQRVAVDHRAPTARGSSDSPPEQQSRAGPDLIGENR